MQKIMLFYVVLALILCSCRSIDRQIQSDCTPDVAQTTKILVAYLIDQQFEIKASDTSMGIIKAERTGDPLPNALTGGSMVYSIVWYINITNRGIKANCKQVEKDYNRYGSLTGQTVTYLDDDLRKDKFTYWRVRDHIEMLCGTIKMVEAE